jgi:hypothetical protein
MTLAQLEQRVFALEQTVEQLKVQVASAPPPAPAAAQEEFLKEEDIIPGAEYDLVVDVPPIAEVRLRGRLVSIEEGPQELGFSEAEWASLDLEEEDA